MNFCYIFTIFCAIFLLAVIFVNHIEAYVARRHNGKIVQQLNEFRQEALKTNEDLEKLTKTIRENQEHGKRQRRQTTSNILNSFPQNNDNGKFNLDAINPNPLTDFSKEVSFGGVCKPDSLKHSLQSSKEFNGFLSNLKLEHTQMPRDLNIWEREQQNGDENEETNESRNNEENNAGRNGEAISELYKSRVQPGFSKKFRFKDHLYKNSKNHAQNTEMLKSFLRENSDINSHQTFSCLNSDLSSCQHCAEHEQVKNMNNNAMKNKYSSRISDYQINKDRLPEAHDNKNSKNFPKTSKHLKKLQSFGRKYPTENQKDEDDDEDEEEDSLYQLRNPSVISNDNKHETENRNSSPHNNHNYTNFPNMENKTNSLNDQLENTKNNLSHEANYKLSKVEQDASEKKNDFEWKWGIFKRSYLFNPMNEIKLKTSSRLMKKGFGASLPSYSLGETRKELMIENMLRRKEMEMLQQKNQKYEVGNLRSFKEPFGSHIRENNKHLEDFEASPLEPDVGAQPQNNWNYNRRKRISDSLARYKREQQVNSPNEMIGLIDNKAFNKSSGKAIKSFKSLKAKEKVNNSLRSEATEVQSYINKPNDKSEDSIKSLNPKDNIDGDISNQIEASKRLENSKKALKLRDTVADDEDINNQIEESELKNTSANFAVQNEPHFLVDSIKETYKIPNFQDFPEILDTINTNLQNLKDKVDQETNFKTVRRRKRSILMKTFTKDLDAVKTANISQNKSKNSGNFSITQKQSLVIPLKKKPKPFKILKRVKRLKPSNILQLKIYQKFDTPPALRYKYYKLNGQSFKKLLKYDKRTRNKRSLQSKFIALNSSTEKHNFITKLTKKLYRKARNLKKHFKAFVKKSLQYLTLQEAYNRILKKSQNSLNENYKAIPIENIESEALNVSEPNKKADAINLNKQMINESFTVDAPTITYKININPKLKFLRKTLYNLFPYNQSFKHLNDKEHTVYYKDRLQRFVKNIKQIDNGTENSSRNSKANNNATDKATTSNFNQEDSIKVRNMLGNNLNQTLSSNESFVSRKRQKRAIAAHYKRTLKHLKLNRNDFLKRSQIFAKTLKRSKRSLNSKHLENSLESDTTKHFNDKRYFSQFDDLYKPQHRMDFLDRKQSKLNQGNDFDFQRSLKSFNTDQFNSFKQKDNTYFDNLWFKDKSSNDNFKERKRFLKPKKTNQRNTPKKYFKRHNFNILQKNLTSNETNDKNLKSRDFPLKVQMIKDKYLSDLKDFNQNYKFNENHFNWPNPIQKSYIDIKDNSTTTDDSQKLGLELRNEILNCKAFASLEEFLKSLPKNITNSLLNGITEVPVNYQSTEQIEMAVNTPIIMEVTTNSGPTVLDSTINCSTTTEANTFEETETNTECTEDVSQQSDLDSEPSTESRSEVNNESSTESSVEAVTTECLPSNPMAEDEDVKLNITINANVQGNPKTHQFCGNGSFNFMPGLEDERRRREIFYSSLENFQKRKCAQIPTQKPYDAEDNEDFSDLMSGKLSSNLVKTILNTVRESPNLKVLWPSLQHNQAIKNKVAPNFYAIRNQQNENQLQNHEKLLAQIMSSINNIIEQQARSHACVPLRPDLQEFYNMILQSRREQDMVRDKRQLSKTTKNANFSYKINLLDSNKIEEETKIVKKLLKQYEELPQQDQQQVSAVRNDLVKNLLILRQLQDDEERQDQELRQRRQHVRAVEKERQSQYSEQYLKLLKAAEFYREFTGE